MRDISNGSTPSASFAAEYAACGQNSLPELHEDHRVVLEICTVLDPSVPVTSLQDALKEADSANEPFFEV